MTALKKSKAKGTRDFINEHAETLKLKTRKLLFYQINILLQLGKAISHSGYQKLYRRPVVHRLK